MINFYHRFLSNIANTQASLHKVLKDQKKSSQTPVNWTPDRKTTFKKLKDELANATLLAFPDPSVQLAVQTDTSGSAIGGVLQQRHVQDWQPLSFFSRSLTPAQCSYSAYDRELLVIYAVIKHFRFMLKGKRFFVITLTFAFAQKLDRASPRQSRQLAFIAEFTTDIRHVPAEDNPVTDAI